MDRIRVIARAFQGEPLERVAVGRTETAILISHPDRVAAVERGDSTPVAFHAWEVFRYDEAIFKSLRAQWEASGSTATATWDRLDLAA